jgi:hypothetical protein
VSLESERIAARHDVYHAREQISETIAELEQLLTTPVRAVKRRLDVKQMVLDNPWTALAVAAGVGAAVAASGADTRAASVAVDAARQGAVKAVETVKEGGAAGARMAREAPSKTRTAVGAAVDAVGAKLALALIDALRESGSREAATGR